MMTRRKGVVRLLRPQFIILLLGGEGVGLESLQGNLEEQRG
jgi:hypothetical protein